MANDLVGVLNALALVGFRRSLGSDVGGELADLLLVDAVDDDLVLRRDFDGDAIDLFDGDQVGVTQVHDELVALFAGTIANAVDLEFLLEALGHADDHVVDEAAGQAVEASVQLVFGRTGNMDCLLYTSRCV